MTAITLPPSRRAHTDTDAAGDMWAGIASMAPLVAAYAPFALVIGTVLGDHGGVLVGLVGTVGIFGGSAHLATIRTLSRAGTSAAILAGLVIHARLLVYSAGLARLWRHQPLWFRLVAAPMVIDPTWAAAQQFAVECPDSGAQRRRFLAAGVTLGVGFSVTVAIGMVLGSSLPTDDLEVAVPLCLIALAGAATRERADLATAAVAATVALFTVSWPSGSGLLVAIIAGCLAGAVADRSES